MRVEIAPGVWKIRFGEPEAFVPSKSSRLKEPLTEALAKLPEAKPPFEEGELKFSLSSRGALLELPLAAGEDVYGLGLHLKNARHTGKKKTLRVNSDPVADTGDSHAPAPVYFSSSGYGVLVDSARYLSFYCGGNKRKGSSSGSAKDPGAPALSEAELYASSGEASAPMLVDIPSASGVDVFIFGGPTPLDAVRRYVLFSGGGCLPPEWGLGVCYRACASHSAKDIEALAKEIRDAKMPCDVLGLEPGWQSRSYSCSFAWSDERFPEPEKLLKKLREDGFRVNLWEHCFVHPESPLRAKLESLSGDFEVWKGLVPDFALKEAVDAFAGHHRDALVKKGVSAFKLDECDNSDYISSPWSFPECSKFPSGLDGEQAHSLLGVLYQATVDKACREGGVRSYGNVRSSHAFASPWPYVLYSDLYKHEDFIRGVVSAGFSGMLWTPELRHASSPEDYVRRLQAMILSPQMLLNIWSMPHPPWEQLDKERNRAGELLPEGERETLRSLTRAALRLRMAFLPYLHAAFAAYRFEGTPPFRALAMDFPEDKRLRGVDWAWLAGPDLLVAPFVAGAQERLLPLPEGDWFDFHSGARRSGETLLKPELEKLPVFVRGPATIPFAEPVEHISDGMKLRVGFRVYGDGSKKARLFAEDGFSFAYEKGDFAWGEVGADGVLPEPLKRRYESAGAFKPGA